MDGKFNMDKMKLLTKASVETIFFITKKNIFSKKHTKKHKKHKKQQGTKSKFDSQSQFYNNDYYQLTLLLNTTLTRCHCPSLTPPEMKLFTWLVVDDNEPFSLPKDTVNTTCPSINSSAIKSFLLLYLPLYRRTPLAMYVLNSRLIVIFQRRLRPEVNAKKY